MKLTHITFQGGRPDGPRFSDSYEEWFVTPTDGEFHARATRMLALIRHLEQEVDAPPHWVCTSHADVVLYNRDFEDFGDAADAVGVVTARLSVGYAPYYYEVRYYLPPSQYPWHTVVGTTDDVQVAGRMVVQASVGTPRVAAVKRLLDVRSQDPS